MDTKSRQLLEFIFNGLCYFSFFFWFKMKFYGTIKKRKKMKTTDAQNKLTEDVEN
jgi:hypothetical protein